MLPGMSQELFVRLTRLAILVTTIATAGMLVVSLFASATGAYPSLPIDPGAVSRLLVFFLPQALSAGLPIGVLTAVFLACRRTRGSRALYATVGAFTIAGALATAALSVWVVPVTNASYRTLAFGDAGGRMVNGLRLNEPGGAGDRFQARHRWTFAESVVVLGVLAIVAGRVAHRQSRQRNDPA
jgi:hypothetical protein